MSPEQLREYLEVIAEFGSPAFDSMVAYTLLSSLMVLVGGVLLTITSVAMMLVGLHNWQTGEFDREGLGVVLIIMGIVVGILGVVVAAGSVPAIVNPEAATMFKVLGQ